MEPGLNPGGEPGVKSPDIVVDEMTEAARRGNIPGFFSGALELSQAELTDPQRQWLRGFGKKDPDFRRNLRQAAGERIKKSAEERNGDGVRESLRLVRILGIADPIDNSPEESELSQKIGNFLEEQEIIYGLSSPAEEPAMPTSTRRHFLRNLVLGVGGAALALTGAGIVFTRKSPEDSPKPPENLFNEFIKPFIEEAMLRRKTWAESDPEYHHMIDKELNENRLNIVVFGYGEEHGESYEDYGGAPSVFSLDFKTGKIAIVHFSRDIRAPDLERLLPEGQRKPLTIRDVYRVGGKGKGGFNQMRYLIGRASGLVADYQLVMKDLVLRDVIAQFADGNLEIDVPKDHDTGPFRLDRKQYGDGLIKKGRQSMDINQLMRYVLAEDKNPQGKQDERSYRKNQVTEALVQRMRGKFKQMSLFEKIDYLNQIKDLIERERRDKNLELEFDPNLLAKAFDGMLKVTDRLLGNLGQNIELIVPEIDKSREIIFHDPYFGDGGVTRVHNILNFPNAGGRTDNPRILEEVRAQSLPAWMLIPDGGNPYSDDLIRDYWQATRSMVKQKLT